jgi:hypothetical protein
MWFWMWPHRCARSFCMASAQKIAGTKRGIKEKSQNWKIAWAVASCKQMMHYTPFGPKEEGAEFHSFSSGRDWGFKFRLYRQCLFLRFFSLHVWFLWCCIRVLFWQTNWTNACVFVHCGLPWQDSPNLEPKINIIPVFSNKFAQNNLQFLSIVGIFLRNMFFWIHFSHMRLCFVSSQIGDGRETKTKRRCHKFLSVQSVWWFWDGCIFFCSAAPCAQHSATQRVQPLQPTLVVWGGHLLGIWRRCQCYAYRGQKF